MTADNSGDYTLHSCIQSSVIYGNDRGYNKACLGRYPAEVFNINVEPKPEDILAYGYPLMLSLKQTWTAANGENYTQHRDCEQVGDSVTREITLDVEGLPQRLPKLNINYPENIRVVEKPQFSQLEMVLRV